MGLRGFSIFLKRALPKTLFACTCMETNRVALLPPEVRHQSFELRHDSIGGKVTTGYEGLRSASTTMGRKAGR